jgi:hypothetical protein
LREAQAIADKVDELINALRRWVERDPRAYFGGSGPDTRRLARTAVADTVKGRYC